LREVEGILAWYFGHIYGVREGRGVLPFYCDPQQVGAYAVAPAQLAAGEPAALFQLLITLSMYQALRDTVVMARQRATSSAEVAAVAGVGELERGLAETRCESLLTASSLSQTCSVTKASGPPDCVAQPGLPCPVKRAAGVFGRMGKMGKLPASAYLRLWCEDELALDRRRAEWLRLGRDEAAAHLVRLVADVDQLGRKLATLYVSALATEALAPGLSPWSELVAGDSLVVVDVNVARVVDRLSAGGAGRSYDQRAAWLTRVAHAIDLRQYRSDLPETSPRLVQQAMYRYASRSTRRAWGDRCAAAGCGTCPSRCCPFLG
jgi:hypothetical protein